MENFVHGEFRFDVIDEGPRDGAVAVLLHGLPQDATAWSAITPTLNQAGIRTLALHQRGMSPGARPKSRRAYRLSALVGDVLAMLDAAEVERAHLVGHDWGGGIAWLVAMHHPARVESMTVLSTPHPRAMAWAALRSSQGFRSSYMWAMQLPRLPEWFISRQIAQGGMVRVGIPAEHAHRYATRMMQPDALTCAINWYRGLVIPSGLAKPQRVTVPTTLVWGKHDPYLGRAAAERTAHEVTGPYRFVELDEGHWLPERRPDEVTDAILTQMDKERPLSSH